MEPNNTPKVKSLVMVDQANIWRMDGPMHGSSIPCISSILKLTLFTQLLLNIRSFLSTEMVYIVMPHNKSHTLDNTLNDEEVFPKYTMLPIQGHLCPRFAFIVLMILMEKSHPLCCDETMWSLEEDLHFDPCNLWIPTPIWKLKNRTQFVFTNQKKLYLIWSNNQIIYCFGSAKNRATWFASPLRRQTNLANP